jgi:hypothetical protein
VDRRFDNRSSTWRILVTASIIPGSGQIARTDPVLAVALVNPADGLPYAAATAPAAGQIVSSQPAQTSAFWSYAAATGGIVNTTTAVTVKTAAGASVRNYLQTLTIDWDTLGAATELVIRSGAGGTVLYRTKIGTVQGGKTINFNPPIFSAANTLLEVATLTASVTGGVFVNATGWTGA